MTLNIPVVSRTVRQQYAGPPAELVAEFDALVAIAAAQGFQLEGLPLARALLEPSAVSALSQLLLNGEALARLRGRAQRIEFISDGPLPPALLTEPAGKSETIYTQKVDYSLCKGCRLCIQVCPKQVYLDDGFGKPDELRHEAECTGNSQCGQCVYVCPERAISMSIVNPLRESTLFVLLENPYGRLQAGAPDQTDFEVANPLAVGEPLQLDGGYDPDDLAAAHRVLDAAAFYPVIEVMGSQKHLVDARDPHADLRQWAQSNGRSPDWVLRAVRALYAALPTLSGLKQGKYRLDTLIHRIIDELLHADVEPTGAEGRALFEQLLSESYDREAAMGSKRRPIGGLLPPGTSVAWKTPYGNEVPAYTHLDKCLGPECGLCVNHCPEGNGGDASAIRMVPMVPLGTIPTLVRGMRALLLRLDGAHASVDDAEDLFGKQAFAFRVDPDYCKACGICIACCPHDVIEATPRIFELGGTT